MYCILKMYTLTKTFPIKSFFSRTNQTSNILMTTSLTGSRDGLVGYDDCLTRSRSWVRFSVLVQLLHFFMIMSILHNQHRTCYQVLNKQWPTFFSWFISLVVGKDRSRDGQGGYDDCWTRRMPWVWFLILVACILFWPRENYHLA